MPVTDFHEETALGMKVKRPGPISSAIASVEVGLRPTRAARQLEWESRHLAKDSQVGVGGSGFNCLATDGEPAPRGTWRFVY